MPDFALVIAIAAIPIVVLTVPLFQNIYNSFNIRKE
jgi:hypothetical protein